MSTSRFVCVIAGGLLLIACGQVGTAPIMPGKDVAPVAQPVNTQTIAPLTVVSPVAVSQTGQLSLNLNAPALAAYKLMAKVSDVKTIKVTLSGTNQATKEVTTSALNNGKGSILFETLKPGNTTVTVEAYDKDVKKIGTKEVSTTVVAGQTAVVAVGLKLDATNITNSNGNLAIELNIVDGDEVVMPIATPTATSAPLTPVATPTPGSDGSVVVEGNIAKTWLSSGKVSYSFVVKNNSSSTKTITAKVEFQRKGIIGKRVVETRLVELGTMAPGNSKTVTGTSDLKLKNILGDGDLKVTII
jgi:hypothetical protein